MPEQFPRCELYENKMVRNCSRLYPGQHPCDVIEHLRVGEKMTLKQIAEHLGVGARTVFDWQPRWLRGVMNVPENERERRRKWMEKVNEGRRGR